ncbi:TRAP transporter substrate-binding protein DctP [Pikeienuella sp. HZG-20]|uniref:TRAP transporter substrate-binding protein DctP n=1 Tax=Paludibacillus litoralis TaxID=3133267 RepID=UPI0030ECF838
MNISGLAGAAALAFSICAAGAVGAEEQKTHEFTMATSWVGGPIMEIGAQGFADAVRELSDGRIQIEVFPAGTLGPGLKVSETVQNGIADMGHLWSGYDWGGDPTAVLFGGYAGSFDAERMLHWLYRGGGVELWEEWRKEQFNLVAMPVFIRTAEVFLHSRKPVRTLEDLQGLKLRTAGAWLEMAKTLGAAPVTMPGGDVYTALERGAIDATEWGTLWEDQAPGFHQVTKYVIIPGVHQPTAPMELVVNPDVWAELSERDQQLIRDAAFMTTINAWLTVGQEDAKSIDFYKSHGNEIIELDPEVQYQAREIGLEWAEGIAKDNAWFKKVFESQKEFTDLWKDAEKYRNVKVREVE